TRQLVVTQGSKEAVLDHENLLSGGLVINPRVIRDLFDFINERLCEGPQRLFYHSLHRDFPFSLTTPIIRPRFRSSELIHCRGSRYVLKIHQAGKPLARRNGARYTPCMARPTERYSVRLVC